MPRPLAFHTQTYPQQLWIIASRNHTLKPVFFLQMYRQCADGQDVPLILIYTYAKQGGLPDRRIDRNRQFL